MHENRETSVLAALSSPAQEGEKPKLGMNGTEESESAVVPMKEPNEGRPGQPEEVLEGRAGAKENRGESRTDPTHSGDFRVTGIHPCAPTRAGRATSPQFADAMIQGRSRMR